MKHITSVILLSIATALVAVFAVLSGPRQPAGHMADLETQKRVAYRELSQETGTTPGFAEPEFGRGTTGAISDTP